MPDDVTVPASLWNCSNVRTCCVCNASKCFVKAEADIFNYRHRRSLRLCHMCAWLFVTYDVWERHLFFLTFRQTSGREHRGGKVSSTPPDTHTHTLTHTSSLCSFALYSVQLHFNTISGNVCAAHGLDYHPRQGGSALTSLLCGSFSYISL